MKKIMLPLAVLFSQAVFSQQTILANPIYDNIKHEEQSKPSGKILNQAKYALIDNVNEPTYRLAPKYWLTLSRGNLKSIDAVSTEQATFRKADYKYGIFLLHNPAIKKNPEEFLYPY